MKKLSIKELQKKLQQMETEKQKMEINLRMNAHINKRFGYHAISKSSYKFIGGNMKKIRKTIAFIKTILHLKLKGAENGR